MSTRQDNPATRDVVLWCVLQGFQPLRGFADISDLFGLERRGSSVERCWSASLRLSIIGKRWAYNW